MPQFDSGAAEQIGRFSEGLLLRLLHPTPKKRSRISIEQSLRANRDMVPRVRPRPK